jgi:hypothetical protein
MDRVKSLLSSCALLCICCTSAKSGAPSTQAVPVQPTSVAAPATPPPDSVTAERARYAREVLTSIAGHEGEPAGKVFKNLKTLTDIPASRLLAIMNFGYGRSLGVSCSHCHVVGQWDSDSKPQKQIARDMIQMASTINNQLLANIKNLKGPQPIVNCTTCHRGSVKPALNLPQ